MTRGDGKDRKLSRFGVGRARPGPEEDDRPDYVRGDEEDSGAVESCGEKCADCGADSVAYTNPRASLGHSNLPESPLCRTCILKRA